MEACIGLLRGGGGWPTALFIPVAFRGPACLPVSHVSHSGADDPVLRVFCLHPHDVAAVACAGRDRGVRRHPRLRGLVLPPNRSLRSNHSPKGCVLMNALRFEGHKVKRSDVKCKETRLVLSVADALPRGVGGGGSEAKKSLHT